MKLVNVQLNKRFVVYKCDAGEEDYKTGDLVVLKTKEGDQIGRVVSNAAGASSGSSKKVRTILRSANNEDQKKEAEKEKKAIEALRICKQKIAQLHLPMKLVDVSFSPKGEKTTFFFVAGSRVNFRELVKKLAAELYTRIEMRQIGARNEAQIIGGVGCCGRPTCCSSFLSKFGPVSIRMAKEQGLSLEPTKISGLCGRLLCCLAYEADMYEDLKKNFAKCGSLVNTTYGKGKVVKVNVIAQKMLVELKDGQMVNISSDQLKN